MLRGGINYVEGSWGLSKSANSGDKRGDSMAYRGYCATCQVPLLQVRSCRIVKPYQRPRRSCSGA